MLRATKSTDVAALIERPRWVSTGALYALADAVKRQWRDPHPTDEALVRAGLVPAPEGETDEAQ
jgi:hypothetical protein